MSLIPIEPLQDRIIVQRIEAGEKQIGSFYVPDVAKEQPQEGIVLAVGDGIISASGSVIPIGVTEGDTVLFGKYSGVEIDVDISGKPEKLLILKADEILARRTV
jgi:chaperonin GroES